MAGKVGFPKNGHAMTLDGAEFWFSTSARSPTGDAGAMCYVGGRCAASLRDWPIGGDPFFTGSCDSGA